MRRSLVRDLQKRAPANEPEAQRVPDLPVQGIVIHLKALGLTVRPMLIARADGGDRVRRRLTLARL